MFSRTKIGLAWIGNVAAALIMSGCVTATDGEADIASEDGSSYVEDQIGTVRSALCEIRDCHRTCPRGSGPFGAPTRQICIAACEASNAACEATRSLPPPQPTTVRQLDINWTHDGVRSKDGDWLLSRQRGRCDQERTQMEADKRATFPDHAISSTPVEIVEFRVDGTRTRDDLIDGRSFKAWGVLHCRFTVTATPPSPPDIPLPPVECVPGAVCGSAQCPSCQPLFLTHSTSGD